MAPNQERKDFSTPRTPRTRKNDENMQQDEDIGPKEEEDDKQNNKENDKRHNLPADADHGAKKQRVLRPQASAPA